MMADKAWKRTERTIARLLGGERVPITGRQRGDVPDVRHPWLSIEVKHRKEVPGWLKEAVAQAIAAQRGHQLPVAVIHQHGRPHGENLIVLRLIDFVEWFGDVPQTEPESEAT